MLCGHRSHWFWSCRLLSITSHAHLESDSTFCLNAVVERNTGGVSPQASIGWTRVKHHARIAPDLLAQGYQSNRLYGLWPFTHLARRCTPLPGFTTMVRHRLPSSSRPVRKDLVHAFYTACAIYCYYLVHIYTESPTYWASKPIYDLKTCTYGAVAVRFKLCR